MVNVPLAKIVGKSILYASMQFAIGSVEMSSKFSVQNFAKDQITLQRAYDALIDYNFIGFLWTLGVALILYSNYGMPGLVWSLITNGIIMLWIWWGYSRAFSVAVKEHNLEYPSLSKRL